MIINFAILGVGRTGKVYANTNKNNPIGQVFTISDPDIKTAQKIATDNHCEILEINEILRNQKLMP